MRRSSAVAAVMLFAALSAGGAQTPKVSREENLAIRNAAGLQLLVATENTDPTLRITLPGGAASFPVLFPEHVTSVKHGSNDGERLYMFSAGARGQRPQWRRVGSSLEYERDSPPISMTNGSSARTSTTQMASTCSRRRRPTGSRCRSTGGFPLATSRS